jgi:LCP family protein required for cell wall assembly
VKLIPTSRGGALARFALGAFIVIAFTATTAAVAGLLQFKQLAHEISVTPALKHANVTIPNPGDPQTILVIGSDHRAGTSWNSANTDTMMLIRLDPNSSTINLLSIPRDLRVQILEHGFPVTAKLNSAYAVGGPNLLIKTIQRNVFPDLRVNHIVDINFGGFEALVNAIGCVYTDVDHRYYNNTALTNYSSINIQPGYQKLCGSQALSFVRFRHSDSDIVRNARQQDFIRWAKEQYSQTQLIENRDNLVGIFGRHAQTDENLHTTDGLINLFNLVAFMDGHAIKQVAFPAILLPCGGGGPVTPTITGTTVQAANATQTACYVSADPGAEQRVFNQFMTPTSSEPSAGSQGRSSGTAARPAGGSGPGAPADLTADSGDGRTQVAALGGIAMRVYYPRLIASGSTYCADTTSACPVEIPSPGSYPRKYVLRDQRGTPHPAYRITIVINSALGEYYGIQGTTWRHPPILGKPQETRFVNGKRLLVYTNGGKVSVVGWSNPQGVYWVSNTLTDALSRHQMIGIAASLTR